MAIVVPRSGERASATPSVIAHAAVAVGHRVADIDNSITLAGSAPQRDGEDQFYALLVRLADLLLTLWAATSLVAIAGSMRWSLPQPVEESNFTP